ncbi:MAG: FUN14 domain-containing protein [Trueperaceae bacterium]|nr:FUN14 domain-containing protein [Trueperaceae bacterium]
MNVPDLGTLVPVLEQLGFGLVAGFVAGYALKKLGKLVSLAVGLLFIALQLLAWSGYVTIEWGRMQQDVEPMLQASSLDEAWRSLVAIMTYNLPFAAAFVPGFLMGLRRG